ncbi:MAG: TIGR00730 family Rossman fold protein [Deltaproteobacteria bacterium]|nr:TIGR00730 family Rossman fold protein [Deltaproteobacteria bacterium]
MNSSAKPSRRICVYCGSSEAADHSYLRAARRLGEALAEAAHTVVYGGGAVGSMGALADGALAAGGQVIGIMPHFMAELEWGHACLSELQYVEDMRTRKHLMLTGSDAVVTLPGGSGTYEELFEALTLKRLGIYLQPIILVNTNDYFSAFFELFEKSIGERFMNPRHRDMWTVVAEPDEVLDVLEHPTAWPADARDFAPVS